MGQEGALLITGGAGYVGSHAVLAFLEAGYRVVVLDDLSTGSREAVPPAARFVEGNAGDAATVATVISEHGVAAVVHLAASTGVADSCLHPARYHRNNALTSANLIRACAAYAVRRLVFASSAAVYGIPQSVPVPEEVTPAPVSPYGRSKLATERLLGAEAGAAGLRYAALRIFNVAGADPLGRAGPSGAGVPHLVEVACQAAGGRRAGVIVFGTDYDTPDGTCLRDYIHVSDLAGIQVAALRALDTGATNLVLNCGTGRGASVRDVIRTVQAEAGLRFDVQDGPRRAGDPPALVADTARLRAALAWTPRHPGLASTVRTALAWERRRTRGQSAPRLLPSGGHASSGESPRGAG